MSSTSPRFADLPRMERLADGGGHSPFATVCALDEEGRVFCRGNDAWGQSGSGAGGDLCMPIGRGDSIPCQTRPVRVAGGDRFRKLAVGAGFTCALTADGRVLCWGVNDAGQLGDGTFDTSPVPVEVRFP